MYNGEKIERNHGAAVGREPRMKEINSLLKEPGRELRYVFSRDKGGEEI